MSDGERRLAVLVQTNGKAPFEEWLQGIRDKTTRLKILRQIDKLTRDLGTQKHLKGIAELKIDLGPGYRVYFALLDQKTLVVLIGGGDKSSQSKDIENAGRMWKEFEDSGHAEAALRLWNAPPPTTEDKATPMAGTEEGTA
jgi:putative addiction module killer protein